ncbi:MAG: hypothetical protein KatS3mg002_0360 [Candidatus Woesearchaeota archaeon]|nr:MAG: hypothetical protein KatS3mg002_0360 [Candidatus Woesearchaeota archaeon]
MVDLNLANSMLRIAYATAKKSRCFSRQIGAVLTNSDTVVITTATNGPPFPLPECDKRLEFGDNFTREQRNDLKNFEKNSCPRRILGFKSGEGLEYCLAVHAERNALLKAAKLGVSTKNGKLFLTCNIPCKDCLIEILEAGIKEIYVTEFSYYDKMSEFILRNSNLEIFNYKGNKFKIP